MSWSGDLSKKLGEALRDWIPNVLQFVQPYFTPEDVKKGERWGSEIAKELEASEFGILCVTSDNLDSGWMLFEAGCLAKNLKGGTVCPILFNIKPTDLKGPLQQFQATSFSEEDVKKLLLAMNESLKENKLSEAVFTRAFDKWWPDLKSSVDVILSQHGTSAKKKPARSDRDILEEILTILRTTSKTEQIMQQISSEGVLFDNSGRMLLYEILKPFILLHDLFEENTFVSSEKSMQLLKDIYGPLKLLMLNVRLLNRRDEISSKFSRLSFQVSEEALF